MNDLLNILEESFSETPLGRTKNFVWFITPLGIAALSNKVTCESSLSFQDAIDEGFGVDLDLSREENESYNSAKGLVFVFYS